MLLNKQQEPPLRRLFSFMNNLRYYPLLARRLVYNKCITINWRLRGKAWHMDKKSKQNSCPLNNHEFKNKTFFHSLKYAFKGLFYCFKTEKNFFLYIIFAIVALVINCILSISFIEWVIYIISVFGAFSMECVNTAVEKICNLVTMEKNESIRIIKDIAAAAVLCQGFVFFGSEFFYIIKYVFFV